MKWKDKRDVLTISTEFPHSMMDIEIIRNIIKKPISFLKYNEHMSGIDRQDQMTSYYPFERKTLKWYKKVGIHCIHLLLINSYFLYNKYAKKTSLYEFRLSVIESLLPNNQTVFDTNTRIMKKKNKTHFPKKVEKNDKKNTNTNVVKFVLEKAFVEIRYIIVWNTKKNQVYVLKVALKNTIKKYNY